MPKSLSQALDDVVVAKMVEARFLSCSGLGRKEWVGLGKQRWVGED